MYFSSALVLTFSLFLGGNAQLQADYSSTPLPRGYLQGAAAYYDGDDRIYLLGGNGDNDDVLLYKISSDTVELVGHLPHASRFGSVQPSNDGKHLFYFGGRIYIGVDVYRYDLEINSSENLTTLSYNAEDGSTEEFNSTHILLLGGDGNGDGIMIFSTEDFTYEEIGTLRRNYYSLGSVKIGSKVYIMGATVGAVKESVEVLDLLTLESNLTENVLPSTHSNLNLVWDGRWIWVVGGWVPEGEKTGGILQLDPDTLSYQFFPVERYLVGGNTFRATPPSSVFVPSLNRIYCFGGMIIDGAEAGTDKIFWIDLNPLNSSAIKHRENLLAVITLILMIALFSSSVRGIC